MINTFMKSKVFIGLLFACLSFLLMKYDVEAQTTSSSFSLVGIYKNAFSSVSVTQSCLTNNSNITITSLMALPNSLVGLSKPKSVALDSQGNIYIADMRVNQIKKFGANGVLQKTWGNEGGGKEVGNFKQPYDLALDSAGNIYVADYGNHSVQKFVVSSGVWEAWCSKPVKGGCALGKGNREFWYPRAIAADDVSVYVADASRRVQILSSTNGTFVQSFKPQVVTQDIAFNPGYVTGGATSLYLTGGNVIRKYVLSNGQWSESVSGGWPKMVRGSVALALDYNGNVYSANTSGYPKIIKFSNIGAQLKTYIKSAKNCYLGIPSSIVFHNNNTDDIADDYLYVNDIGNNRFLKIQETQ